MKKIVKLAILTLALSSLGGKLMAHSQRDSILVMSEQELITNLCNAINKYKANRIKDLTAEDIRLLKYQILLNSLGTFSSYPSQNITPNILRNSTQTEKYQAISSEYTQPKNREQNVIINNTQPTDQNLMLLEINRLQNKIQELENKLTRKKQEPLERKNTENKLVITSNSSKKDTLLKREKQTKVDSIKTEYIYINNETLAPYFFRQVFFKQGSAILNQRAQQSLNDIIAILNKDKKSALVLTGYASPEGSVAFNQALCQKRSKAVQNYLQKKGIPLSRLRIATGSIDKTAGLPTVARRVDLAVAKKIE